MNRNPFLEAKEAQGTATAAVVLARDPSRRLLQIQNNTGAAWKYRFGAAPDANNGLSLAPGATATYDVAVPLNDLFIAPGSVYYIVYG